MWVVLFGIAFAWVESAVVVYLREIYYDGDFYFPILIFWEDGQYLIDDLMKIELARELATIIMLISIGCIAGRTFLHGFSYFIISFGIWDIFYYIWLWVMIRWPESLMTWDLLFLIPLPWVGPVITPVLIAAAMVAAGSAMLIYMEKYGRFEWGRNSLRFRIQSKYFRLYH